MSELKKRTALVTGGAGAIGTAIVEELSRTMKVYFTDISEESGKALENKMRQAGADVTFIKNDVHSEAQAAELFERVKEQNGGLDALINNVGLNVPNERRAVFYDYDPQAWELVTGTCLDGLYHMTKSFLPMLKQSESACIVNIGSVTGFRAGLRYQCAYNVCKALIHNMTRGMAIEYGAQGITVNSVIPGSVMNPMISKLLYQDKAASEKMFKHVPIGRAGCPEDIANAVGFCVSEKSRYLTGCLINVDGGWAAGYSVQ